MPSTRSTRVVEFNGAPPITVFGTVTGVRGKQPGNVGGEAFCILLAV